jgi:hypothetical protein
MPLPEPDDSLDPRPPAREGSRPDWLVGADEGAGDEMSRDPSDVRPLKLTRPEGPPAGKATEGFEGNAAQPKKAWVAAASSVPALRLASPIASVERRPSGPIQPAAPARQLEEPEEDSGAFPDDDVVEKVARAAPVLPPLKEAWWVVALDELRTNSKVQLVVVVAVVVMVGIAVWPKSEPSVSLSTIRHHASAWDGRSVALHGRIGEVFPVAGGYTFYLHQGRDTIVVFTRVRVPVENENVTVRGSISTGYLDGAPRQTLFESSTK